MPGRLIHQESLYLKIGSQDCLLLFKSDSRSVVPFFRSVFREFIVDDAPAPFRVEVIPVSGTCGDLFDMEVKPDNLVEYPLSPVPLSGVIRKYEDWMAGFSFSDQTIGIRSQNGLLVYSPETGYGRILVSKADHNPYRSLYRLFWIYFAQIMGERGGCFLHAAGLVRNGMGSVFIGAHASGKSTLARSVKHADVLGDDAPVLFADSNKVRVYPSPYHQMGPDYVFKRDWVDHGAPLERIFFVIIDDRSYVEPVHRTEATAMILARYIHFFAYLTPSAKVKLFDLFHGACNKLTLSCLHHAKDLDLWKVID